MGIGFVMFGKAVVLGLWAALVGIWRSWKDRRAARGIPLKFDKKRGVYVPSNWPEKLERTLWIFGQVFMWGGFACSMVLCAYLYLGGRLI